MNKKKKNKERLEALLYITSKDKFHILECEALAKSLGAHGTMTFDLVGPSGRIPCRWWDAHMGMFRRTDRAGGFSTRQFQYVSDVHCENLENFS